MTLTLDAPTQQRSTVDTALRGGLYAERVTMRFGSGESSVTALEDCSVAIAPGERVSIIGPPGCGKSTLLRISPTF